MVRNIEKVAIVKCNSYKQNEVDEAVENALALLNFDFKKGMKVLIKPNVVGCFPKKQIATTTHPSIIEAVCKILKKNNCKIFIGDSPFTNPESSFRASGIDKVAKKYGKLIIFEQDKLVKIRDKKAKVLKSFETAKTVRDADLIINVPKLKTHSLTKYTGAVKNLYGIIPGGLKQRLHNKAHGDKKFSNILADIYQNIKPGLTIMDGIIGMEGEGPTSGYAKKVGLIIVSKNGIALDMICTKMIGLNPRVIYAIKESLKRKIYPKFRVQTVGEKFRRIKFKLPNSCSKSKVKKLMKVLFKEKPIVCDKAKCIRCGLCMKHCPGKAIKMIPYPIVNRKKCIRCFCCIEICPRDAMMLKCD